MPDTARYTLPTDGDHEIAVARLWAAGALGVWERGAELVAWFAARDVAVPDGGTWSTEADRDWQADWKATIAPVTAGRFVVVPTWLADEHRPGEGERTLVLDPGRAFGSGHHATTTQCLELLEALGAELDGAGVLDVGTGTGILAIGAVRAGAAEVVAVDVDLDAVEVTRENAHRNEVTVEVRHASADLVEATFDVVLANLVTDTIVALAETLCARVRPGGVLIASGIATQRRDRVITALMAAGLATPHDVRDRDGWTALATRRPSGQPTPPA